jgi:hypothetical protein
MPPVGGLNQLCSIFERKEVRLMRNLINLVNELTRFVNAMTRLSETMQKAATVSHHRNRI